MEKTRFAWVALLLTMLLGSSAFAAQVSYSVYSPSVDGITYHNYYLPTTVSVYSVDSTIYTAYPRLDRSVKFKANGATNYPYGIYLPNGDNPAQYRIHTNYTNSTDACASCHSTHTAVGPSLLQWYSVYEACLACHDGTVTTTYNVVDGNIGSSSMPTYGGKFGVSSEDSGSSHNVTGAVEISAAPGGSTVGYSVGRAYGASDYMMWKQAFGCESCHSPHGQGGNARILNPDPNGWALYNNKKDYSVSNKGYVYDGAIDNTKYLLTGYPYLITIAKKGDHSDISSSFEVYNDGGDFSTGAYTYLRALGSSPSVADIAYVEGVAAIQVRMKIDNYLAVNEKVYHVTGINDFCGACHVDYNTSDEVVSGNGIGTIMGDQSKRSGYGDLNGVYSKGHRHAVGLNWNYGNDADKNYIGWNNKPLPTMGISDNGQAEAGKNGSVISCLTCHFAHGTSQDFWGRWVVKFSAVALDWSNSGMLHEISGSSALKRLPNMATCEACHQKGEANAGYAVNTAPVGGSVSKIEPVANVSEGMFAVGGNSVTNAECENAACHQHTDKLESYKSTKHNKVTSISGCTCHRPVTCEDCHKTAGNHLAQPSAKNIYNPRYDSIAGQIAVCDKCHNANKDSSIVGYDYHRGTANWKDSGHYKTGVMSCETCHDSHKHSIEGKLLKGEYNALCASCHDASFDIDVYMKNHTSVDGVTSRNHRFIKE